MSGQGWAHKGGVTELLKRWAMRVEAESGVRNGRERNVAATCPKTKAALLSCQTEAPLRFVGIVG